MKKELVYSTNGKSLQGEVTNHPKISSSYYPDKSLGGEIDEKLLTEVFTNNVSFIDSLHDNISGVDSVIRITNFLTGYIQLDSGDSPLLKVFRLSNKEDEDIFFVEVYDATEKELYYSFNVFFKGNKIAEMELIDNIIMEVYCDHLEEIKNGMTIKFI